MNGHLTDATRFGELFNRFCQGLLIDSKEEGVIPLTLNGCQRHYIKSIEEGLANDIHWFVFLKPRQVGISTVSLGVDLFWPMRHPGLQGAVVTDTDSNRDYFRSILDLYLDNLPRSWRYPTLKNNREGLIFKIIRSRLVYLTAGTRIGGNLGRGKGINYLHATECSSWVDEEAMESLKNTLAESYANRLFIWESTARGFDLWYDEWRAAKKAPDKMAVFIGWWMNERYAIPKHDVKFLRYWDGTVKREEKFWIDEIKRLYGWDITQEQLAWWRWKLDSVVQNLDLMMQDFPPTEDDAFIMSGSKFFSWEKLTTSYHNAEYKEFIPYRFEPGVYIYDLQVRPTKPWLADMLVWEKPRPDGVYIIAADPAFGANQESDAYCIQVIRCFLDRCVQVAEMRTVQLNPVHFAWILLYLCGAYESKRFGESYLILEMNGPGRSVFATMQNIQQQRDPVPTEFINKEAGFLDVMPNIRNYLWKRVDSLSSSYAYQFQTTDRTKEQFMNDLKGLFEIGMVEINSLECLSEMRYIINENGLIRTEGRMKDDRVMALGLAVHDWKERPTMMRNLKSYNIIYANREQVDTEGELKRMVSPYDRVAREYLEQAHVNVKGMGG